MNILKKTFATNMGLGVCVAQDNLFNVGNYSLIKEISSDTKMFKINPVVFAADPFLFVKEDTLFLFYEEQKQTYGKGVINMLKTKDLITWTKPIPVLNELFHLSFPFVFNIGSETYMIPESRKAKSIRLYRSVNNLEEWEYVDTLLAGDNFVDSSIIEFDKVFYLFTTTTINDEYRLKLFYSDKFPSGWIEHKCSPLVTGKLSGRNGGSVFKYNDQLFRPAQNCEKMYGEKVAIYKILEISRDIYKEELLFENILPKDLKFFAVGGHQFNYTYFKDKIIVTMDALQYTYNILEFFRRLLNKAKGFRI